MLKSVVRRLVVWSARPPFKDVYVGMYSAAIRLAVVALGRHRGVKAVYLGRGCAKNEISPGISDIDLTIITEEDNDAVLAVRKTCRALRGATGGLIEYFPNLIMSERTLRQRWRESPAWQSRLNEGRTTYKLLYGRDVLSSLPPLTEAELKAAVFAEMNLWWLRFAYSLLLRQELDRDAIATNAICYKVVGELLNSSRALETGELEYSRARGLRNSPIPLARKLEDIAAARFLRNEPAIAEETYRFLLDFFEELWDRFRREPFLQVKENIRQRVDCPASELSTDCTSKRRIDSLKDHIERRLGTGITGIHLVKSAFWELEDSLMIIDAAPKLAPTVRQLADLVKLYNETSPAGPQRLYLFVRLGQVCFPLTPEVPSDYHRYLLTPATAPDVFLQLGEDEVYWTEYTRWYLTEWKSNERWPDISNQKKLQLEIIEESAKRGLVVYPLTTGAIDRTKAEVP